MSRPIAPITEVAASLGLDAADVLPYGHDKAKVDLRALARRAGQPDGKLVLVSSITPTPPGDGKTTITIGREFLFQHLVVMVMTTEGTSQKHNKFIRQRHHGVLQRVPFFFPL